MLDPNKVFRNRNKKASKKVIGTKIQFTRTKSVTLTCQECNYTYTVTVSAGMAVYTDNLLCPMCAEKMDWSVGS